MKPVYTYFRGTTVLSVLQFLALSIILLVLLRGGGGGQHTDRLVSSAGCSGGRESDANLAVLREQLASLLQLRVEYGQLSCQVNGIGPTGGFCLNKDAIHVGGNHMWDAPMCQKMADMFAGKTVLDLGAGLGHYGKCLREADPSITWSGADGSEGIEDVTDSYVEFMDLTIPQYVEKEYDWVMSLEVGEHIPQVFESAFIGNIVRHAKEGVLLSWALPGQGGHHHVNGQTNEYITGVMKELGWTRDESATDDLRAVASLPHFQHTVMVFRR